MSSTPTKPTAQLNRAALGGLGLKGLPIKPDVLKQQAAASAMDDFTDDGRKLVKLGELPPVDLAMSDGAAVGNLELAEEDDDEDADIVMAEPPTATPAAAVVGEAEEDDVDPLDAFMSGVKDEVQKVNAEDRKKMVGADAMALDNPAEGNADDDAEGAKQVDELDATDLRPEDILAYVIIPLIIFSLIFFFRLTSILFFP